MAYIFISYVREDQDLVDRLSAQLKSAGLEVWLDREQIKAGQRWQHATRKAIEESAYFIACFSAAYQARHRSYANEELTLALEELRLRPIDRTWFIPALLDKDSAPDRHIGAGERLRHIHWVDLYSDWDRGVRQILDAVGQPTMTPGRAVAGLAQGRSIAPGVADAARKSPRRWSRLLNKQIIMTAMLIALSAGLWWRLDARIPAIPSQPEALLANNALRPKVPLPRPSVAVMTFENRSGESDLEWLSTALSEGVSSELGVAGDVRAVDRQHVSLAETDLLLRPQTEASARDLARIRGLLGVDFVIGGNFDRVDGTPSIRLALTLYNAGNGRVLAQTQGEGEVAGWLDLANRATGDLPGPSLRHELKRSPLTRSQEVSVQALFPIAASAAKLYFQGLERYRHFDILRASDFFRASSRLEPHPLVLAALADTCAFLGRSQEARQAVLTARRLEEQVQGTSRALPERYQREIEIIQRKVASDPQGTADRARTSFQEFFADDLSYGLIAGRALIDAGSGDSEAQLHDLRLLPLAANHPGVELMKADALFVQQRYGAAQSFARRAIAKAQALGAVRQEAQARLELASILSLMGEGAETEEQFRQARDGFERTGDRRGVAQCLENAALFYLSFDLRLAQDLYRQAIARYEALGDQREKGRALFGLSAVLTEAGRLSEAKESSREAVALASSLEDGMEPFLAGFHAHLAGQLTRAQGQYEAAEAIFDLNKQRDNYAITLTNLGEVELMRGRLSSSANLHRLALGIHLDLKLKSEAVPYDQVCLGRVYAVTGEYGAARIWYDQALHTLNLEGGPPKEPTAWAEALLAMAELELLTGHSEKSEERVRDVLDRAVVDLDALRSRAFSLRARRLLGEHKTQEASEAGNEATKLAPGDFRAVREAEIVAAHVRAARGEVDPALKELGRIAAEAAKWGQVVYELESILAAGEIELADGQLGRGRRRLEELRNRAARLNFGQLVKRVASALEE